MANENDDKKKLDIKIIATIVAMTVMGGGLLGQWYTNKAAVTELEKDVAKIERVFTDYKKETDKTILNMKLDITASTSDITTIKEDIGEIKTDVKSLLKRPE